MDFIKTEETSIITKYRKELYTTFITAIDGMWESRYIANASNYLINIKANTIGYCCINSENTLLQVYVKPEYRFLMQDVISKLIDLKLITTASLSSIEPIAFNISLALSKTVTENTYCFQYVIPNNLECNSNLLLANKDNIKDIKMFLLNQIGFIDNIGYTENLIQRNALYYIQENDTIIATGEYRQSTSQPNIVDLGVIVNKDYRKRGIAANILKTLAKKAIENNKTPICSTTLDNIASKKAIEKAGFYCSHIIFDMAF